jgi:hypothetical protein
MIFFGFTFFAEDEAHDHEEEDDDDKLMET